MHPKEIFDMYDKYYRALYTTLYALLGRKPHWFTVEAKIDSLILPKLRK